MQLGSFGGHLACSQAGSDPEIIVMGGGGERGREEGEAQACLTFQSYFTYFLQSISIDHSMGTKISEEGEGRPSF